MYNPVAWFKKPNHIHCLPQICWNVLHISLLILTHVLLSAEYFQIIYNKICKICVQIIACELRCIDPTYYTRIQERTVEVGFYIVEIGLGSRWVIIIVRGVLFINICLYFGWLCWKVISTTLLAALYIIANRLHEDLVGQPLGWNGFVHLFLVPRVDISMVLGNLLPITAAPAIMSLSHGNMSSGRLSPCHILFCIPKNICDWKHYSG